MKVLSEVIWYWDFKDKTENEKKHKFIKLKEKKNNRKLSQAKIGQTTYMFYVL